MKVTRAYAEESAKEKGYEPIQVDGIPEGFSFKKPDIDIGGKVHVGELIAFIPLAETERELASVTGKDVFDLLENYFFITKRRK